VRTEETVAHLVNRGYDDALLQEDEPGSIPEGESVVEGIKVWVPGPSAYWVCRSLSGTVSAIHTAGLHQKDYRVYQDHSKPWLPLFYGSRNDSEMLVVGKPVILVEGVYDRVAMKVVLPEYPTFARLTKGVGQPLRLMLMRHAKAVILAFDDDEPGQKATERAVRDLEGLEVIEFHLSAKDPSEYLKREGREKMRARLLPQLDLLI